MTKKVNLEEAIAAETKTKSETKTKAERERLLQPVPRPVLKKDGKPVLKKDGTQREGLFQAALSAESFGSPIWKSWLPHPDTFEDMLHYWQSAGVFAECLGGYAAGEVERLGKLTFEQRVEERDAVKSVGKAKSALAALARTDEGQKELVDVLVAGKDADALAALIAKLQMQQNSMQGKQG